MPVSGGLFGRWGVMQYLQHYNRDILPHTPIPLYHHFLKTCLTPSLCPKKSMGYSLLSKWISRRLDGLKPQHLRDMVSPSASVGGTALLSALTSFISLVLKGMILLSIRPYFWCHPYCFGEERWGCEARCHGGNSTPPYK